MIDFKKDKVSGIPKDKLAIYNNIYGFGLTEEEIKNTEASIIDVSSFPEKTLAKVCKIIKTESGMCALMVRHIINEQESSRSKYHSPERSIVLIGGSYLPPEICVGDYLIDIKKEFHHDPDNNEQWIFEKNFIFRYKPTVEQLEYTTHVLNKWRAAKFKSKNIIIISSHEEFANTMHKNKEVLKGLMYADARGENTDSCIHHVKTIEQVYNYFGIKLDHKMFTNLRYSGGRLPKYISEVLDVHDLDDNNRLVLITTQADRNTSRSYSYRTNSISSMYSSTFQSSDYDYDITIAIVSPDKKEYDYMDVGRYFLSKGFNNERAKYIFPAQAFFLEVMASEFPKTSAPLYRHVVNSDEIMIINSDRLTNLVKKYNHLETMKVKQEEVFKLKLDKVSNKMKHFIQSNDHTLHFNLNGVIFYKDRIEWEEQILKSPEIEPGKVLYHTNNTYRNSNIVDFDLIADEFFALLVQQERATATIGSISISFEQRKSTGTRYYVNDHRINKDDVLSVLKRALCYQDLDQYNGYLDHVSKCSLTIYEYLCSGLKVQVTDDFLDTDLNLLIPLDREKNKTVIVANGKKFVVSNINKLLVTKNARKLADVITRISDPEIVKGITADDIAPIIEASIKEHKEAIRKNKELVNKIEKTFNIKLEKITFPNGKDITGYIIKGSWRQYAIDAHDGNCYTYPDGRRLCMIDKSISSIGEYTNTSKIASRIFALKNDKMVADRINTIKPGETIGTT